MWHLFSCIFKKKKKKWGKWFSVICTLSENCPYSEFFWSVFSRIRTEYGDLSSIGDYWGNCQQQLPRGFLQKGAVSLKRDSRTSVFLWILRNLLWKISANDSFWRKGEESERAYISIIFFIYVTDHLYIANHEYDDIR